PGSARPATARRRRVRSRCSSKMAAVAIAATVVQSYRAQASVHGRLSSVVAFAHARAARPASLREGMGLPRFDPAAKSCSLAADSTIAAAAVELSRRLPGGPLYYKDVLTRFYLEFFYPHDSEHEYHPRAAEPASPSGLASLSFTLQAFVASYGSSRVSTSGESASPTPSAPHFVFEGAMKYSDRHLAGLSAGPPDCVELIGAGSLGYGTGPSFG
ncbi:hypothetical protein EMIHUDRAFT_351039, partial [Emiliania huxleyi CCMP1516]